MPLKSVDCTHMICASPLQSDSPAFEAAGFSVCPFSVVHFPLRGAVEDRPSERGLSEWWRRSTRRRKEPAGGGSEGGGMPVRAQGAPTSSSVPETLRNRV